MDGLRAELERLEAERDRYAARMLAPNTRIGYAYDVAQFQAFCYRYELKALPASTDTVCLFVTEQLARGNKVATAKRRMFAVLHEHKRGGVPLPDVERIHQVIGGAQRLRAEQPRQMRPLTVRELRTISAALRQAETRVALRNRALLVMGVASALRRSTLVSLTTEDVEFSRQGVIVTVRQEKNDQEAHGRLIGLPRGRHADTCPVRTLRAWLRVRGDSYGPIFWRLDYRGAGLPLAGDMVTRIVKACVERIGLDPRHYGAHSLRAAFITAAGGKRCPILAIAAHSGHKSLELLRTYFRRSDLWRDNPAGQIGL